MKKKIFTSIIMLAALVLASCSDSNDGPVTTPATLSIEMPLGIDNVALTNAEAVFTNVQSSTAYTVNQFVYNNGSFTASVGEIPKALTTYLSRATLPLPKTV